MEGDGRPRAHLPGWAGGGSGAARASRRARRAAGQALPRRGTDRAGEGAGPVSAVPDYIEPIVGWRSWLVVRDGEEFRLHSIVYEARWFPRNELIAPCLQRRFSLPGSRRPEARPPAPAC